jgi:creatinine amidohydrolase
MNAPVNDWRGLTVGEVTSRLRDGAVALWAIGATEQHGPHAVTGFDHLAAEWVVNAAATRLAPRAVALPTLQFGCSGHWMPLGGTLTLTHESLLHVMRDVCRSAARAGAGHVVIVNGHNGNVGTGVALLSEFVDTDLRVEFVSYWELIDRATWSEAVTDRAGVGHAGQFETSVGLHIGGMIKASAIPEPPGERPWEAPASAVHRAVRVSEDAVGGVVGLASTGSAELGSTLLESAVSGLVSHCRTGAGRPAES